MYVKINNGAVEKYPYSIGLLRKDNPRTSFPKNPSDTSLAEYGVFPVTEASPTVGSDQKINYSWTPELINGNWTLNHQAVDMTSDEMTSRDNSIARERRATRDSLLSETDFYALSDVTMSAEMTTYRQALRDITNHANWPNLEADDWPVKP